jgi:tetratricopeptide (TPR) repeat protein
VIPFRKIWLVLLLLAPMAQADTPEDLLAAGRVDEMMTAVQTKLKQNPNDGPSNNLLCRAYLTLENWDRGIETCQKAVAADGGNSSYHLWLGRVYGGKADRVSWITAAGLAGKVRNEFETAVKLSPNDPIARVDLAEFYLEAPGIVGGGKDKAAEQATLLMKGDPARAYWVLGRLAEKKNDFAEAEKQYKAGIEASQGGALAWLNLALFYKKTNRLDEMEAAIAHAAAANTAHTEVLVDAATTLFRTGRNFPQAIDMLQRYLASNTTVEDAPTFKAHYLLGSIFEKQGNRQAAAEQYRAALSLANEYSAARDALNRLNR